MDKKAIKQSLKIALQRLLNLLVFLIGSKGVLNNVAIAYFSFYFTLTFISLLIVNKVNPSSLSFREESSKEIPIWDKIILPLFWILNFILIYFFAGMELNTISKINMTVVVGFFLVILSSLIATKAMCANPFMGGYSTVQKEKGQIVVQTGIYKIVRHPTYLAIIIHCIAIILIFKTILTILIAFLIIILIVVRTYKEDKYLKENLDSYAKYCEKSRYRLFPLIW
jgi:protein-S-isoprenylcysteine O-methyltransferase Ste14